MQRLFYWTIGGAVAIYILWRSITVGVTFDEAWTILDFTPQKWLDIISYNTVDANNHLLNTLLTKLFRNVLGGSLFVSRLPNVLAGLVYIGVAAALCRRCVSRLAGYGLFIVLLMNPFVLDFFGLSRGYGLALAFQLSALYYLFRFVQSVNHGHGIAAIVLGGLAILSNFSFITFFVALLITTLSVYMLSPNTRFWSRFVGGALLVCISLTTIIYGPLKKLAADGSLYYGGGEGFLTDSLGSLTTYSMYATDHTDNWKFILAFLLMLFALLIGLSFAGWKKKTPIRNNLLVASVLLVLCVAGIVIQHLFLDILYPHDRAVLYLYPLIALVLYLLVDSIVKTRYRRFGYGAGGVFAGVIIINFLLHMNTTKTATWFFDAHSNEVIQYLEAQAEENETIHLSSSWPFKQSVAFYLTQTDKNVNYQARLNGHIDRETDYYLWLGQPLKIVNYKEPSQDDIYNWTSKDTVLAFPEEKVWLFRVNHSD